jgi:hypothetical protein
VVPTAPLRPQARDPDRNTCNQFRQLVSRPVRSGSRPCPLPIRRRQACSAFFNVAAAGAALAEALTLRERERGREKEEENWSFSSPLPSFLFNLYAVSSLLAVAVLFSASSSSSSSLVLRYENARIVEL